MIDRAYLLPSLLVQLKSAAFAPCACIQRIHDIDWRTRLGLQWASWAVGHVGSMHGRTRYGGRSTRTSSSIYARGPIMISLLLVLYT